MTRRRKAAALVAVAVALAWLAVGGRHGRTASEIDAAVARHCNNTDFYRVIGGQCVLVGALPAPAPTTPPRTDPTVPAQTKAEVDCFHANLDPVLAGHLDDAGALDLKQRLEGCVGVGDGLLSDGPSAEHCVLRAGGEETVFAATVQTCLAALYPQTYTAPPQAAPPTTPPTTSGRTI